MIDIAEVALRSGLPASTLRYYEEQGLISSIGRRGLRRLFEPAVLGRLALISLGRTAGFSLDEIASMVGSGGQPNIDRTILAAKADELDAKISWFRDILALQLCCPSSSCRSSPRCSASSS